MMCTVPEVTLSRLRFPVQYIEVTESMVRARHGRVPSVRERCGLPPEGHPEQPAFIDGHQLLASVAMAQAQ